MGGISEVQEVCILVFIPNTAFTRSKAVKGALFREYLESLSVFKFQVWEDLQGVSGGNSGARTWPFRKVSAAAS